MTARKFEATQAKLDEVPLLIGIIGPPGGGKTYSALRLASGMRRVRSGPIVLIDTERGRASKYSPDFDFMRVAFDPPFVPADFLEAVKAQLPLKPCAIIIDSLSDEHEGEGGVLDWHDEMVPKMGGNEWAAWAKPKASRRTMINGFLQIKVPLIFTFRAREKTKQIKNDRGKNDPINIGYQPIAPSEVVYSLDLTCILPPRAMGVPIWHSDKVGEDFIIKLPNYLKPFIEDGKPLCEEMGAAFARWAAGQSAAPSEPPEASPPRTDGAVASLDSTADGAVKSVTIHSPYPNPMIDDKTAAEWDLELAETASRGTSALQAFWKTIPAEHKPILKAALDRRHKQTAAEADKGFFS